MLALAMAMLVTASGLEAAKSAISGGVQSGKRSFIVTFESPELRGSGEGDVPLARVGVRLPAAYPACRTAKQPCWLLLYLPGFDSGAEEALALIGPQLEALEASGKIPPVVAVVFDGRTALGGGWYVDGATGGYWSKLLLDDVMPAARQSLLDAPETRTVVVGHSMGGFGALRLAELHPELFHGVGVLNPILRPTELASYCASRLPSPELSDGGLDPRRLAAPLSGSGFCARIVRSLAEAFARVPGGAAKGSVQWTSEGGWDLTPWLRVALNAEDLISPDRLAHVTRLYASTGARDPISPSADLNALAEATGSGDFAAVTTRITPGDHMSHLAEDFAEAVHYVTATSETGSAGPR